MKHRERLNFCTAKGVASWMRGCSAGKRKEIANMDLGVVLPITHFAWKYYNSTVPSEKRKSIERFRVNKESGQIFSTGRKSSSAV